MPAGRPWLPADFAGFPTLPAGMRLHRIGRHPHGPLRSNPVSEVRFALPGTHSMFYAGATPSVAMWETLFRDVPGGGREVLIGNEQLKGRYCVEIELTRALPHLAFAQPPMAMLMTRRGAAWNEVEGLCKADTYEETHTAVRELERELSALGQPMPVLSWPSRQDPGGLAYLAYEPPVSEDCWRVVGTAIDLDTDDGRALIHAELERCGMRWVPLATKATRKRSR